MERLSRRRELDDVHDLGFLDDEVGDLVELDDEYLRDEVFVYIDGALLTGDGTHGDLVSAYFAERGVTVDDECVDLDDVNADLDEAGAERVERFSSGELFDDFAIIYQSFGVADEDVARALGVKTYLWEDEGLRRIL